MIFFLACTGPAAESAVTDTLPELDCSAEPDVTWDNWGEAHFATHCDGCHAATTPNRYGAPETSTFDTAEQVAAWSSRIYVRVVEERTMPPAGGLRDDELEFLTILLVCGL